MAYTKQNFRDGDILPASQLNAMDDQIAKNETDIGGKVDKVAGKGLSTNDYTTADKNKVAGIPSNPKYTDTQLTEAQIEAMGFTKGGSVLTEDQKNSLSNLLAVCAFKDAGVYNNEYKLFCQAWGIGWSEDPEIPVEPEPDNPVEPDDPDDPQPTGSTDPRDYIIAHSCGLNASGEVREAPSGSIWEDLCIIETPKYSWDIDNLGLYDADTGLFAINGAMNRINVQGTAETYKANPSPNDWANYIVMCAVRDNTPIASAIAYLTGVNQNGGESSMNIGTNNNKATNDALLLGDISFKIPVWEPEIDNVAVYWKSAHPSAKFPVGVSDGDIIFAGRNTEYYGKTNIND